MAASRHGGEFLDWSMRTEALQKNEASPCELASLVKGRSLELEPSRYLHLPHVGSGAAVCSKRARIGQSVIKA